MARQLSFTRKAVGNLDNIWNYSQHRWGPDQARVYTKTIRDDCLRLLQGKAVASRRQVGNMSFLKLRVGSHLIFLAEREEGLLVVRILHARQDIDHELG